VFIFGFLVFVLGVVGLVCWYDSQMIGWKDSSRNDLLCVEWDVKLYSLTEVRDVKHLRNHHMSHDD